MTFKKDKKQVIGEDMTDEQIQFFLQYQPHQKEFADFLILLKAYRGLRAEDFRRFLVFFVASQKDLNALGPEGKTILDIIRMHRNAGEYIKMLESLGAQGSAAGL